MIKLDRLELTDTEIHGFSTFQGKEILSIIIPLEPLPNETYKLIGTKEFLDDFIKIINVSIV